MPNKTDGKKVTSDQDALDLRHNDLSKRTQEKLKEALGAIPSHIAQVDLGYKDSLLKNTMFSTTPKSDQEEAPNLDPASPGKTS